MPVHRKPDLTDLGVRVPADEHRSAAICVDAEGASRLVIGSHGWVLVVDPGTGRCDQLHWPDGEQPFAALATRDGRYFTGAGQCLIEVDPFALELRVHRPCDEEGIVGFGFAEGPDGRVWFTTYPHSRLFSIDTDGAISDEGRLSETEQYAAHLAVADDGWVYAGVGTQHRDLVALLPGHHAPRSLLAPDQRTKGSGYVHRGTDGRVYGHADSVELHPLPGDHAWFGLDGGQRVPVDEVAPTTVQGRGFGRIHVPIPVPWRVVELDLPDHRLVLADAAGERIIPLDYASAGAKLSPFTAVGDGRIIGTANHPLRLYEWDPATGDFTDHGTAPVAEAGGNVCAWARQGDLLAGAAYAGGHFYLLDPARPIVAGENPRHVSAYEEVHRPRAVLAHPDGRHVLWSGYGGYGDTGGGLVVHRLTEGGRDGTDRLLPHTELVPHQATTALGVLSDGTIIGATSVETPGGATPETTTATVHRLSWPEAEVVASWTPVDHVRTWAELAVAPDDTVHLLSSDGWHLRLDPIEGRVLALDDWSAAGEMANGGVVLAGDGAFFLQRHAITRVDLVTHACHVVATPDLPVTAGGAVIGPDLYVASSARMLRIGGIIPASMEA